MSTKDLDKSLEGLPSQPIVERPRQSLWETPKEEPEQRVEIPHDLFELLFLDASAVGNAPTNEDDGALSLCWLNYAWLLSEIATEEAFLKTLKYSRHSYEGDGKKAIETENLLALYREMEEFLKEKLGLV